MIPFEIPAPSYVNKTYEASKFWSPRAEVGSIDTTVPYG